MNMGELCTCGMGQICPFCKLMVVICIAVLSGVLGFLIGRRKRK